MKPLPPLDELRNRFRLDAETGVLYWRSAYARYDGRPATSHKGRGYLHARYNGRVLFVHRIVFALANGRDPFPFQVDHINGNRRDNRPANLRLATNTENVRHRTRLNRNNGSGHAGVYWHRGAGKWAASIRADRATKHLGLFDDIAAAVSARETGERLYWSN